MKKRNKYIYVIIISIITITLLYTLCTKTTKNNIKVDTKDNAKIPDYITENLEENSKKIYVSPTGNDSNSGLIEQQPLQTIEKAKEKANELKSETDIVIILANGDYYISKPIEFTKDDSADINHTITYLGMGDSTINGGKILDNNWIQENSNIWKIQLDDIDNVNDLYIDGEKEQVAQETFSGESEQKNYLNVENNIISIPNDKLNYDKVKNDTDNISVNMVWEWKSSTLKIDKIEQSDSSVNFMLTDNTVKAINKNYPSYKQTTTKYTIKNAYGLMDKEGEYYFDKNNKCLYLYTSENPNNKKCIIPVATGIIKFQGTDNELVHDINFENINFKYAGGNENSDIFINHQADGGYTIIDGAKNYKMRATSINFDHASRISFKNDNFENISSSVIGIDEYVYNINIENNTFKNDGGTAIRVGKVDEPSQASQKDKRDLPTNITEIYSVDSNNNNRMPANITIKNNNIEKIGNEYLSSTGVSIFFANTIYVQNNSLNDLPYTGIHVGWGWVNSYNNDYITNKSGKYYIEGNKIENTVNKLNDGAPIYALGGMDSGSDIINKKYSTQIDNNYINTNMSENGYHGGIYIDEGSSNIEVNKNVVIDCNCWLDFRSGVNIKRCYIHDNITNKTVESTSSSYRITAINDNVADTDENAKYNNIYDIDSNKIIQDWQSNSDAISIKETSGAKGEIGIQKLESSILKKVTKIEVYKYPEKLKDITNVEDIDLTGGEMLVTYSDGSTEIIEMTNPDVKITAIDGVDSEIRNITLEYKEKTITLKVEQSVKTTNTVKNEINNTVKNTTKNEIENIIKNTVGNKTENTIKNTVENKTGNTIRNAVENKTENITKNTVANEIDNTTKSKAENEIKAEINNIKQNKIENAIKNTQTNNITTIKANVNDNTISNIKIPKTGTSKKLIILIIIIISLGIVIYKKYQEYREI